jgi:hypothetical protein
MEYWKKREWSNGVLEWWGHGIMEMRKEKAAFCSSDGLSLSAPILHYSSTPITYWVCA